MFAPNHHSSQKGQAIVLIVITVFMLVVMAGLVVDGGNAYLNRRKAQTAADAAVLAAAHNLCVNHVPSDQLQPIVDEYATVHNDADSATYSYSPPDSEYPKGKITVETEIEAPTFFARILGQPTVTTKADASSGCFLPAEANNLIPVAWTCNSTIGEVSIENCNINQVPVPVFDYLEDLNGWDWFQRPDGKLLDAGNPALEGGSLPAYAASFMDDTDGLGGQGKLVYLVMDDADFDENLNCKELNPPGENPNADPPNPPGVGFITCDFDGDGIVNVQGSERGWLCLYEGCGGASDLWDLMLNGYDEVIQTPQWFTAIDGVQNSTFDKANEILFRKSLIPVFNAICPLPGSGDSGTTDDDLPFDCPDQYVDANENPNNPDIIMPSTGSNDYYRVPGIAVFVITCVSRNSSTAQRCPGKELAGLYSEPNLAKTATLEGYFLSGYVAGKKISTGGFDLGVYVLSLTE